MSEKNEQTLDEVYKNPEFASAADALIGRIMAYRKGNALNTDKESVISVANDILESRFDK